MSINLDQILNHKAPPRPVIENLVTDGAEYAVKFNYHPRQNELVKRHFQDIEKKAFATGLGNSIAGLEWHYRLKAAQFEGHFAEFYKEFTADIARGKAPYVSLEECLDGIENAKVDDFLFMRHQDYELSALKGGGTVVKTKYVARSVDFFRTQGFRFNKTSEIWLSDTTPVHDFHVTVMDLGGIPPERIKVMDVVYADVGGGLTPMQFKALNVGNIETREVDPYDLAKAIHEFSKEDLDKSKLMIVAKALKPVWVDEAKFAAIVKKYDLAPHQVTGLRMGVSQTSYLNADDMGMGKTRGAVATADYITMNSAKKVLIIVEKTTVGQWCSTIRDYNPEAVITVNEYSEEARWTVVNFEAMEKGLDKLRAYDVVVVDEAHNLKNLQGKTTELVFKKLGQCERKILLTGTPILNRLMEFYALLRLGGHPLAMIPLKDFVNRYNKAEGFVQLREGVKGWMCRHMKSEIAGLKGKRSKRQILTLTEKERRDYNRILKQSENFFSKCHQLMRFLEVCRLRAYAEYIKGLTGKHRKMIFFTSYRDTLPDLQKLYKKAGLLSLEIEGSMSIEQRSAAQNAFQTDPSIDAVSVMTMCGGSGVHLAEANHVFFLTSPWNNGIKNQCEDRANRMGNKRVVWVHDLLFDDTIDLDLEEIVNAKKGLVSLAIDGGMSEEEEKAVISELARRMKMH